MIPRSSKRCHRPESEPRVRGFRSPASYALYFDGLKATNQSHLGNIWHRCDTRGSREELKSIADSDKRLYLETRNLPRYKSFDYFVNIHGCTDTPHHIQMPPSLLSATPELIINTSWKDRNHCSRTRRHLDAIEHLDLRDVRVFVDLNMVMLFLRHIEIACRMPELTQLALGPDPFFVGSSPLSLPVYVTQISLTSEILMLVRVAVSP